MNATATGCCVRNEGKAGEQLIEQIDYGYDVNGRRTLRASVNNWSVR